MNTPPVRRKPAVGTISRAETKKRAPGSPICQCFAIELMTCSSRRPTMCMHAPRLFITFNKTARQPSVSQDLPPVRSPRPSQADRFAQRASTRWSGTKQAVWDVRPPATYIIWPGGARTGQPRNNLTGKRCEWSGLPRPSRRSGRHC